MASTSFSFELHQYILKNVFNFLAFNLIDGSFYEGCPQAVTPLTVCHEEIYEAIVILHFL